MNLVNTLFLALLWCVAPHVEAAADAAIQVSPLEQHLLDMGYVDVTDVDSTIVIDLKYATTDNFTGENLYGDLRRVYLHPDAAERLAEASRLLRAEHPGYRLKVFDGARPMSVQRKMHALVAGTKLSKYVSNPARGGGMHNYGVAVDLTIVDDRGDELPMGSPYDSFVEASGTRAEQQLVNRGLITQQELQNRQLLRSVMTRAGFRTIPSEWWHFNLVSRNEARQRYPVID